VEYEKYGRTLRNLENLGVDGRILLKLTVQKQNSRAVKMGFYLGKYWNSPAGDV